MSTGRDSIEHITRRGVLQYLDERMRQAEEFRDQYSAKAQDCYDEAAKWTRLSDQSHDELCELRRITSVVADESNQEEN